MSVRSVCLKKLCGLSLLVSAAFAVSLFFAPVGGAAASDDEQTVLDVALFDGCPFICPDQTGPFVDGLKAAFSETRYTLNFVPIPYARAVEALRHGRIDLLPGSLKGAIPGALYPDSWLYYTQMCFYSRSGDPWRWDGLASLKGRDIAVERGIVHTPAFFSHVQDNPLITQVHGDHILQRQLQMLSLNRVRSFTAERRVLAHHLEKTKTADIDLVNSGCFEPEFEHVAVNPHHPDAREILDLLNSGLLEFSKAHSPDLL